MAYGLKACSCNPLTQPYSLTFLTTIMCYNSTTVLQHVDSTVFVGITQKVKATTYLDFLCRATNYFFEWIALIPKWPRCDSRVYLSGSSTNEPYPVMLIGTILERGINIFQEEVWLHRLDFFFYCSASWFYQLKTINKVRRSIETWSRLYFTTICLTIQFQKHQEK